MMSDGISHISVDGFDVWCLEDGTHVFPASDFAGLDRDAQRSRLDAAGLREIETVFNAFLIRADDGTFILVDTGCGTALGDGAGNLPHRLTKLGVTLDQIQTLIFTHLHTDHCGGALAADAAVFPNARVVLHVDEYDYWSGEDHLARRVLSAYADRITTVKDTQVIAPGLTAWGLAGHTPGHMGLFVGDQLALCADIIHSEALQLGDPQLCSVHDMNVEQAIDTRLTALREIASRGLIFSGGHIRGANKFSRLAETSNGFERVAL